MVSTYIKKKKDFFWGEYEIIGELSFNAIPSCPDVMSCDACHTAVLTLAREVRARINVVFKMTAVTTTSETNTVNI